jgi:hypothetical protein
MRPIIATLAICCAIASPAAAQRNGSYTVVGSGADGSRYEGTLQLQSTGEQTWRLTWRIGGETIQGVAVSQGGTLAVGYVLGRDTGTALYVRQTDGSLAGIWTAGRDGGLGRERLIPR